MAIPSRPISPGHAGARGELFSGKTAARGAPPTRGLRRNSSIEMNSAFYLDARHFDAASRRVRPDATGQRFLERARAGHDVGSPSAASAADNADRQVGPPPVEPPRQRPPCS